MKPTELTNRLSESRSPYLLQHAQNPVHWQAWNEETLALAKELDKPLLISIGYAACHWCHVMAHETFEDQASAQIMNQHFICVKVDREERPDVDAIYMQAVQMITGSGGWPLHVFALPDGRPFFGGTYFPREQWQQVCRSAAQAYTTKREEVTTYADNLEKGLRVRVPVISTHPTVPFEQDRIRRAAESLQVRFDEKHGGFIGAPKFPMPALLNFLHDYSLLAGNHRIKAHVRFSLQKMSMGGIYDHIGGGFARYAVDSRWKVPHFEKMLYDNAQLLSLLSKAHRSGPSPLFEERIRETADFILRDLRTQEGLFASSLDADSEGVEGKYYVWDQEELKQVLGDLYPTAQKVLNISPYGHWEKDHYILQMDKEYRDLANALQISPVDLREQVKTIKARLFENRLKRKPPLLDDKALASWNALAIMGLADASMALNEPDYLSAAQQAANSILKNLRAKDGGLYHVFAGGTAYTTGFLEDYSQMISALIALYQADLDPSHLNQAKTWMEYLFAHFLDPETGFFYFTRAGESRLIKRDIDLTDGVIPSANSVIAHSLLSLAHFFGMPEWEEHARKMAANLADELEHYPGSYSHWAALYLKLAFPFYDISISGEQSLEYLRQLRKPYRPNTLFAGSLQKSELPALSGRYQAGQTLVYVCRDKVCEKPLASIDDVNRILPAA